MFRLSRKSQILALLLVVICAGGWACGNFGVTIGGRDAGTIGENGGAGLERLRSDATSESTPEDDTRTEISVVRDIVQPDNGQCCKSGARRACYNGASGTAGKGVCKLGYQLCNQCAWSQCYNEVRPSAEVCDGKDNDCDGKTDESFPQQGKSCPIPGGQGSCKTGTSLCLSGRLLCQSAQGGTEVCNGRDDNCNGKVDESDPNWGKTCKVPGAKGPCAAGRFAACTAGKLICTPTVRPSPEVCDGKDNDCDGQIDELFPGINSPCTLPGGSGPCSKGRLGCVGGKRVCRGSTTPQTEVCDGKDNDCDGKIDESDPTIGKACSDSRRQGICVSGVFDKCVGGRLQCTGRVKPKPEICDGKDNDCDGKIDDGLFSRCYPGPAGVRGKGGCVEGRQICQRGKWSACLGFGLPKAEVCDNIDNDCDGQTDEGNVCVAPGRGPVFRFNSLAVGGSAQGFDLNGDGKVDNKLSALGAFLNSTLKQSVSGGQLNLLIELAKLSDPRARNGTATVYLYTGIKSGTGYRIAPSSLDSQKRPLFRFNGTIKNGVLSAGPGRAVLPLPIVGGLNVSMGLEQAYIRFTIPTNLQSVTAGLLGGATPSRDLDKASAAQVPILGGPGKTILDVLVQLGNQPDIDLDRDGLERFTLGTKGISQCTDGNGTKISGVACAQDKRIADGLSVGFIFAGARTKIVP